MTSESEPTSERPSRSALRASLLLPLVISISILLVGAVLFTLVPPDQFNNTLALVMSVAMLAFLVYWTRAANVRLRIMALLFAIPALVGITSSVIQGSAQFMVVGVGITFLLLVAQRAFQVPASYRLASRRFQAGDYDAALNLINKSIEARPDFAESFQLRSLIRLSYKQYAQATADIQHAITLYPRQHQFFNTLGQVELAAGQFEAAAAAFAQAVALDDRLALHHYHLGLSRYFQGQHRPAAEALAVATQKTLPNISYDLLAYYYLYRSLTALKQGELAEETLSGLHNFSDGLPKLSGQLANQPDFAHIQRMRADLPDLEQLLAL